MTSKPSVTSSNDMTIAKNKMMFLKYEETRCRLTFLQAWQCYHLLSSSLNAMLKRVHARDDVVSYREKRLFLSRDSKRFFTFFLCLACCVCGMLNVLLFSGCCSKRRYRQGYHSHALTLWILFLRANIWIKTWSCFGNCLSHDCCCLQSMNIY